MTTIARKATDSRNNKTRLPALLETVSDQLQRLQYGTISNQLAWSVEHETYRLWIVVSSPTLGAKCCSGSQWRVWIRDTVFAPS